MRFAVEGPRGHEEFASFRPLGDLAEFHGRLNGFRPGDAEYRRVECRSQNLGNVVGENALDSARPDFHHVNQFAIVASFFGRHDLRMVVA